MSSPSGKSRGKAKNDPGHAYSSVIFRLLKKHERILRHAGIYFESKGEPINTPQEMVEDAISKYIEYLRKKRNVPFPDYLLGEENPDEPSSPAS